MRYHLAGIDMGSGLMKAVVVQQRPGAVRSGIGTVLTSLGERIESVSDASAVRDHYRRVLDTIRERKLPTQISVKLTHLGLCVDRPACTQNVIALDHRAEECGSFVWIDMEESPYVDDTLEVFRAARAHHQKVGVCLQSYLRRTSAELEGLLPLSPAIRLVKGAYRQPEDGRLIPAGTGMPAYREIFLEKDEPAVVQPSLEDLLRPEAEEDEALSLADFDDEQ